MTTVNTILGVLYVDDHGEPDEPTALLWPSLFTHHRMWRHQIAPLREAGWRTLALDPPGHGRSPGPGRGFTMDQCAQAAVQVLDATDVRAPAVVLGTSWGGFVAPRIAMLAPERLSGMALFNTSAERGTAFEQTKATLLTKLLAVGALDKMTARMIVSGLLAPGTQRREPQLGGDLAEQFLSWDRRRFIATVRSVLVDRDPVLDALPELKLPALIVSGQEDHTLPSFHSQRMAQKLPNARHIEVSGAAHLVPLEAPHEANRLILDFVGDLPRALRSQHGPMPGRPRAQPGRTGQLRSRVLRRRPGRRMPAVRDPRRRHQGGGCDHHGFRDELGRMSDIRSSTGRADPWTNGDSDRPGAVHHRHESAPRGPLDGGAFHVEQYVESADSQPDDHQGDRQQRN
jgi:3-oxoadipate enol-lactonase